jgi:hypothetical protein
VLSVIGYPLSVINVNIYNINMLCNIWPCNQRGGAVYIKRLAHGAKGMEQSAKSIAKKIILRKW